MFLMVTIRKLYIHSTGCSWTVLGSDSCSQLKQLYTSLHFCYLCFTVQFFSSKVEPSELMVTSVSVTRVSVLFMLHVDSGSIGSHHISD